MERPWGDEYRRTTESKSITSQWKSHLPFNKIPMCSFQPRHYYLDFEHWYLSYTSFRGFLSATVFEYYEHRCRNNIIGTLPNEEYSVDILKQLSEEVREIFIMKEDANAPFNDNGLPSAYTGFTRVADIDAGVGAFDEGDKFSIVWQYQDEKKDPATIPRRSFLHGRSHHPSSLLTPRPSILSYPLDRCPRIAHSRCIRRDLSPCKSVCFPIEACVSCTQHPALLCLPLTRPRRWSKNLR